MGPLRRSHFGPLWGSKKNGLKWGLFQNKKKRQLKIWWLHSDICFFFECNLLSTLEHLKTLQQFGCGWPWSPLGSLSKSSTLMTSVVLFVAVTGCFFGKCSVSKGPNSRSMGAHWWLAASSTTLIWPRPWRSSSCVAKIKRYSEVVIYNNMRHLRIDWDETCWSLRTGQTESGWCRWACGRLFTRPKPSEMAMDLADGTPAQCKTSIWKTICKVGNFDHPKLGLLSIKSWTSRDLYIYLLI